MSHRASTTHACGGVGGVADVGGASGADASWDASGAVTGAIGAAAFGFRAASPKLVRQ